MEQYSQLFLLRSAYLLGNWYWDLTQSLDVDGLQDWRVQIIPTQPSKVLASFPAIIQLFQSFGQLKAIHAHG